MIKKVLKACGGFIEYTEYLYYWFAMKSVWIVL